MHDGVNLSLKLLDDCAAGIQLGESSGAAQRHCYAIPALLRAVMRDAFW
jgi:hypothetical protein